MKKTIVSLIAILCFSTVSFAETAQTNNKSLKIAAVGAAVSALCGAGVAGYLGYKNNQLTEDNTKKGNDINALAEAKRSLDAESKAQKDRITTLTNQYTLLYSAYSNDEAILAEVKKKDPNYLARMTTLANNRAKQQAEDKAKTD